MRQLVCEREGSLHSLTFGLTDMGRGGGKSTGRGGGKSTGRGGGKNTGRGGGKNTGRGGGKITGRGRGTDLETGKGSQGRVARVEAEAQAPVESEAPTKSRADAPTEAPVNTKAPAEAFDLEFIATKYDIGYAMFIHSLLGESLQHTEHMKIADDQIITAVIGIAGYGESRETRLMEMLGYECISCI